MATALNKIVDAILDVFWFFFFIFIIIPLVF